MKKLESIKSSRFENFKQHQIVDLGKYKGGADVYTSSYNNGVAVDCWRWTDNKKKDQCGNVVWDDDGQASQQPCDN